MLFIPTKPNAPVQRLSVTLDERNYTFTFRWNWRDTTTGRGGAWFMAMQDDAGNVLLRSVKLALGDQILRKHRYIDGLPPGTFSLIDTGETDVEPGVDDFGTRVLLVYTPQDS